MTNRYEEHKEGALTADRQIIDGSRGQRVYGLPRYSGTPWATISRGRMATTTVRNGSRLPLASWTLARKSST